MSTKIETEKALNLALLRLQKGTPKIVPIGTKISIAAVAKEAGYSNSTIHNRYPDIAKKIKLQKENETLPASTSKAPAYVERNVRLSFENKQLKADLEKSQSINLKLTKEIEILRAKMGG
jgi:cell shape-determining protein MreC